MQPEKTLTPPIQELCFDVETTSGTEAGTGGDSEPAARHSRPNPKRMANAEQSQPQSSPLTTAKGALDQWEEQFFSDWENIDFDASELADGLPAKTQLMLEHCRLAASYFRAIAEQSLNPDISHHAKRDGDKPLIDEETGWDANRLKAFPHHEILHRHLDVALLRNVIENIESIPEQQRWDTYRVLFLTALDGPISVIAQWYLKRAIRLHLLGLNIECLAMCRAVLEAALKYADYDTATPSVRSKEKRTLSNRIKDAHEGGLLKQREKEYADHIRDIGNKALHPEDPEKFAEISKANPVEYIAKLSIVLRRLYPAS